MIEIYAFSFSDNQGKWSTFVARFSNAPLNLSGLQAFHLFSRTWAVSARILGLQRSSKSEFRQCQTHLFIFIFQLSSDSWLFGRFYKIFFIRDFGIGRQIPLFLSLSLTEIPSCLFVVEAVSALSSGFWNKPRALLTSFCSSHVVLSSHVVFAASLEHVVFVVLWSTEGLAPSRREILDGVPSPAEFLFSPTSA